MKYKSAQSGFSLVETLVSITILLLVIVGPMTIMSTTANSTSFASDQVGAFFLAQEGAELAQKARDDLILERLAGSNPNAWDDFTNESSGPYDECFNSSGCGLEISENADGAIEAPIDCAGSVGECRLFYDDNSSNIRSRYTYTSTGNTQTLYTRIITFENISPNEVKVVSRVEWFTGLTRNSQQVEVETYLFDIYGN